MKIRFSFEQNITDFPPKSYQVFKKTPPPFERNYFLALSFKSYSKYF